MAIAKDIEDRIKAAANIRDVLEDRGVVLHRYGGRYLKGLCPFHADRHIGSFVVDTLKNKCNCYSCQKGGDSIAVLMELEGMSYPDALRYLAAMYGIFVDDAPMPKVVKREPRKEPPQRPLMYWNHHLVEAYYGNWDKNNLIKWMLSLPWDDDQRAHLVDMLKFYLVGTILTEPNVGWTFFPMVDMEHRLLNGKMMAYQPDGHRIKDRYASDWLTAKQRKAKKLDEEKYDTWKCLFGMHLVPVFPTAEICIVESEKTALICSAFTDPNKRLWLATGGKQFLNPQAIMPLIELDRNIVLYPDIDGYPVWTKFCEQMDYQNMIVTPTVKELHIPSDGPKADIADIMIRRNLYHIEESEKDKILRRIGQEDNEALGHMIDDFGLKLQTNY